MYKSTKAIANLYGVSADRIRELCRKGKIESRIGTWGDSDQKQVLVDAKSAEQYFSTPKSKSSNRVRSFIVRVEPNQMETFEHLMIQNGFDYRFKNKSNDELDHEVDEMWETEEGTTV